ncbi:MAG: tetratricopeptide repeat protein [Myxococcota bacterium]|nr:tetratricopeptide repeat protein [Myxococcota bacterium]MDW8360803.1 tetratricopeptide repeat protein [Myxococcales bacterium]
MEEVERSMHEFRLAASLREEGNVPGAVQHARRALRLDPDNARAMLLLALIHHDRGEHAESIALARRAVGVLERRDDEPSTLAEARNVLGGLLVATGRHAEAVELLRSSASDIHNREPWHARLNLGRALHGLGRNEEAIGEIETAVRLQPRFCVGHYWLGQVRFASGDVQGAEEAFGRAIEADERCGRWQEAWRLRGEMRARLGRRSDAVADFERCVALDARTETGRACRRYLEE